MEACPERSRKGMYKLGDRMMPTVPALRTPRQKVGTSSWLDWAAWNSPSQKANKDGEEKKAGEDKGRFNDCLTPAL